ARHLLFTPADSRTRSDGHMLFSLPLIFYLHSLLLQHSADLARALCFPRKARAEMAASAALERVLSARHVRLHSAQLARGSALWPSQLASRLELNARILPDRESS